MGSPVYEYSTKEELGRAIGKEMRSSLGVRNAGLADAIIKQLEMKEYAVMAEMEESMAKIKIHELAKELDKQSKDIISFFTGKRNRGQGSAKLH